MKKSLSLGLLIGLSVCALALNSADLSLDRMPAWNAFETDVSRAAKIADVKIEPGLAEVMSRTTFDQRGGLVSIYSQVPADARIERLARYFEAKAVPATSYSSWKGIGVEDVADFHWGYISEDLDLASLKLTSPAVARLLSVEDASHLYSFSAKGVMEPGGIVVIPMIRGQVEPYITATFEVAGRTVLWTGTGESREMLLRLASTSEGAEIHVNSEPTGALIYFNGAKWHKPTNERVVHVAGTWEVSIRLGGYKEWRERKTLRPGGSWIIDARLEKR